MDGWLRFYKFNVVVSQSCVPKGTHHSIGSVKNTAVQQYPGTAHSLDSNKSRFRVVSTKDQNRICSGCSGWCPKCYIASDM